MLSFDMNKPKSLAMPILVEGIDQESLDFKFVIEVNGVSYGFPAIQEEGAIKFLIPALDDVVKHMVAGIYEARLEASSLTQGESGYYMQPWSEKINVKQSVSVQVSEEKISEMTKEEVPTKPVNLKIAAMFSEGTVAEENEVGTTDQEEEERNQKKNEKMRKKFLD
jgi:hypothetical protein